MNEINYYWGIPDASVSFCENKYDKYFWIAEYHNYYIFIMLCYHGVINNAFQIEISGTIIMLCGYWSDVITCYIAPSFANGR